MFDRSKYESIEIPGELCAVVQEAIAEGMGRRRPGFVLRRISAVAAALALCLITTLNVSPAFAQAASGLPVLGGLARVFTFREYHAEDEIKYIDAEIPQIDNTGKTELEQRINLEIQQIMAEKLSESEDRAREYYTAFVETGGRPENFIPVGISLGYEVKHISQEYASFVIYQYETRFSAYNSRCYYNIDMESGRELTLRDYLGSGYREIAARSIEETIAGWDEEQKALLWEDLSVIDLISENRAFYINEAGNAVVVFDKYEAAAGAAGTLEFEILAPDG